MSWALHGEGKMTEGEIFADGLPSYARKLRWRIFPIAIGISLYIFLRSSGQPALTFLGFMVTFFVIGDDAWQVQKVIESDEKIEALKKIETKLAAKAYVYGNFRREIKYLFVGAIIFVTIVSHYVQSV